MKKKIKRRPLEEKCLFCEYSYLYISKRNNNTAMVECSCPEDVCPVVDDDEDEGENDNK